MIKSKIDEKEIDYSYTEVSSFEDAATFLGMDPELLPNLSSIPRRFKRPLIAYFKLMVVCEAINQGWSPDLASKNQIKFYPLFIADKSGKDFSECKHFTTTSELRVPSFLFCETIEKEKYLASQFLELFKDMMLIARSQQNDSVDLHQNSRKIHNMSGYRH